MSIDWSKAPDWAVAHALHAFGGEISEVWVGEDQYQRLDQNRPFPYGGVVESYFHNPRRRQFRYETPRPPRWNGEGLPPIGAVCEFNSCWAHVARGESWHQVTVVYSSDESYVVRRDAAPEGETTEVCGPATLSEIARFRPIRTAEQIAAETRIAEINEMLRHIRDWPRGSHGVNHLSQLKIHEDACCDLYDAGYRKQEAAQ